MLLNHDKRLSTNYKVNIHMEYWEGWKSGLPPTFVATKNKKMNKIIA
jgi:hypothetical protein